MKGRRTAAVLAALLGILLLTVFGLYIWKGTARSFAPVETLSGGEGKERADGAAVEGQDGGGAAGQNGAGGADGQGAGEHPSQPSQTGSLADPSFEENASSQESPITLLFAGDVLLSDHVQNAYEKGGGITGVVDQALLNEIEAGDLFMVNEEFPFSSRGEAAPDKQYTFRLPPEKVSMFHEMGIDLVTLANNHALDFGTDALVDTLDTLDEAGILHVGAGRNLEEAREPVILEIKGKTLGFIGASRVIPETSWNATSTKPGMLVTYDPALTIEGIKELKETCDYVVVYVHWGIERDERPQEYQRVMGQQYIDAGADLVAGSHPHVLQGIEYYKGKPIVYSLGNFVFGSSIPRTALLKVELSDGAAMNASLSLIPATSGAGYTRPLTDEGDLTEFYQYITGISYGVTVDGEGNVREE